MRRLYRMFVVQRRSEIEIAAILNNERVLTDAGRPWTRGTVHQVLTNEKYVGHNVFNRVSNKLKAKRVANPPEIWVRADGAFPAIVEPDFFEAAQRIIHERSRRFSDQDLLDRLAALLAERGWLSGLVIDEVEDMPSILLCDSSERRQGLVDQDFVAIAVALQRSSGDQRVRAMNLYERLLDAGNYYADRAARDSVTRA